MVKEDEDAFVCDMAETYHIFDWKSLPLKTAATLASGLPEGARIRKIAAGGEIDTKTILMAIIADRLGTLVWFETEDGRKNRNRPKSIMEMLTEKKEPEAVTFKTGADFDAAWKAITQG